MQAKDTTAVLFWNVDTQVDFMQADGKLYVQNAEEIKPTLAQLTIFAKENAIRVVNTCDYHNENSAELSATPDFITTFPPHCMENTEGQAFVAATQPENPVIFDWNRDYSHAVLKEMLKHQRNIVIRKDLFDVFTGNPNTSNIVSALAPQRIFVYGVATNVCVDFAIKGLVERGYTVFVIEDAIKELPNIPTPFETWKAQGVTFIKAKELPQYL